MKILPWRKYSDRVGGGLIREEVRYPNRLLGMGDTSFVPPRYVDMKPYFLPVDDQGQEPKCAAHALNMGLEAFDWMLTGKPSHMDPNPLYREAKMLDGMPTSPGTTLSAIISAGKRLKRIPQDMVCSTITNRKELQFALHKYGWAILGFNITSGWQDVSRISGYVGDGTNSLGGHAVGCCYYDEDGCGGPNSWGEDWGWKGFWRLTWDQYDKQLMHGYALCWHK